jgi:hypothetical protein
MKVLSPASGRRLRVLAAALAGVFACTAVATAGGDVSRVHVTPADQVAARAVMLRQADVGDPALWESGAEQPAVSTALRCRNFHPKVSDLVVTGAAAVRYRQPGLVMHSFSEIYRTAKMVDLVWQRSAATPHYLGCVQSLARRALTPDERFRSFRRLTVPSIGTHSEGFRTLVDVTTADGPVAVVIDTLRATRGRTQISLTTTIPLTSVPKQWPHELLLLEKLLGRARV